RHGDLLFRLNLSFWEAVKGCNKSCTFVRLDLCEHCKGGTLDTCDLCRGSGRIEQKHGFIMISQTCPKCQGRKQRVKSNCLKCKEGFIENTFTCDVKVPAGVKTGDHLRV